MYLKAVHGNKSDETLFKLVTNSHNSAANRTKSVHLQRSFFYGQIMREYIIADNQDITKAGMMFLLSKQKEVSLLLEADNKMELVQLLRIHPQAVVILDYTLFDFSGADVSFKYNINFSVNDDSAVSDLVATKYSINTGNVVDLNRDNQSITNEVLQANNTAPIYIRVYVIWDDGENSAMDNTADTEATKNGKTAKMNVNLSFIQLK